MIEFYTAKSDVEQVTTLDTKFHSLLLEASKSRPLKQALGCFNHHVQQARNISLRSPGRLATSLNEHKNILEAIASRNPRAAEEAMNKHVANVSLLLPQNDA